MSGLFLTLCKDQNHEHNQKPLAAVHNTSRRRGTEETAFMPTPPSLRDALRPGLIASAQKICRKTRTPDDMPCGDCIYTVAVLHADFARLLPSPAKRMPRDLLCEEIMGAAQDG